MMRIIYILTLLGFMFAACENASRNDRPIKPNIILINADDLGYGDLGCYGATLVKTPNIDRLAAEGRMFTDAHSASAVCSPSRYGLLTGQYPLRKNFWGPLPFTSDLTIDVHTPTIASILSRAGYSTACIGKWHLGFGEGKNDWNEALKPGPLELGFDYYFGIPQVNSGPPFVLVENHHVLGYDPNDPFIFGQESITQKWPAKGGYKAIGGAEMAHSLYRDQELGTTFKDKAIEWITSAAETTPSKPFFLYLATTNIHHPFTPAPQFNGTSDCGRYGDFIHELDWMVGEILAAIEDLGFTKNTLVIFTSDNGGMLNQGGQDAWLAGHRLNGDLLGFKFGAWEGGHRIPMIARWPGRIPANTISDQLISQIDFLATFAAIVGDPLENEVQQDGYDQLPVLIGETKSAIRDTLMISPNSPDHLVVRRGDWVYIPARDEGGFKSKNIGDHTLGGAAAFKLTNQVNSDVEQGSIRQNAPPAQLYNLKEDPAQKKNIFEAQPEIVKSMQEILNGYRSEMGDNPEIGWIDKH